MKNLCVLGSVISRLLMRNGSLFFVLSFNPSLLESVLKKLVEFATGSNHSRSQALSEIVRVMVSTAAIADKIVDSSAKSIRRERLEVIVDRQSFQCLDGSRVLQNGLPIL
jgi:hypothetical protein